MSARIREEECGSGWGLWAHSFGLCGESRLTAIGIGGLDRVIRDRSMCGGGAPGPGQFYVKEELKQNSS